MADMATALGDNVASLNSEKGDMHVAKSSQAISVGSMQPTSKMSIGSLLSMETQCADFEVDPTSPIGTIIYSTEISPINIVSSVTTRVQWLSRMFRYWKGDMHFKMIFTKTILQQTKFLSVFVPNALVTDAPPTPSEAYFYTHKMVMNPANETEVIVTVPFVSDRPFLELQNSTGMFYLMVYQPVVASFDASTVNANIYVKMFVSAHLEMHETIPLPPLASAYSEVVPLDVIWSKGAATLIPVQTSVAVGDATLRTDSGKSLPCDLLSVTTPSDIVKYKPYALSEEFFNVPYNPTTCFTLDGKPTGAGFARKCLICAETGVAGLRKMIVCILASNVTGVWITADNYGSVSYFAVSPQLVALASPLTCFTTTFSKMTAQMLMQELGIDKEDLDYLVSHRKQKARPKTPLLTPVLPSISGNQ